MKVKIGSLRVDVLDKKCSTRACYALGFDRGTFVPGRGYTRYYDKPKPVCWTRNLHGCPSTGVCPSCRTLQVEGVTTCRWCSVEIVPLLEEKYV